MMVFKYKQQQNDTSSVISNKICFNFKQIVMNLKDIQ
jgi:hypothetical protein